MSANGAMMVTEALAAFKARDRDRTAYLLAQALRADPPLGDRWGSVSRLAATIGEVQLALAAARRQIAHNPANGEARLAYAQILSQNGRVEQARDEAASLVRDQPMNAQAIHFLATCLIQLGDNEGGIAWLRKAIALPSVASGSENAWHMIAVAKKFTVGDPDIAEMEKALARLAPTKDAAPLRAVMLNALGKVYDDIEETERAFEAYAASNQIMHDERRFDVRSADAFISRVTSGYTREFMDRLPPSEVDSNRPIFVLGLPRSGTTLVEQILVSHSQVSDGAEANLFRPASMAIGGYLPEEIADFARRPGADKAFTRMGKAYLHMLDQRFGKEGRVVDKTLNHSPYLGLIHHVLPNARFIWLRRAPGGVAWSCFRTRFARGVDWSRSLKDIARYFRGEERLHAHWTSVMPEAILTVQYEDLVSDPETWIPRMLEHVGLPFEEGLQDFHKTNRAVTTASVAQVRQPLYTSSKEAWRRYESQLKPFFDAYHGD